MKRITVSMLCLLAAGAPALAADLYQEGQFRALAADLKAQRVGDTLVVLVTETSSATATADTNAKRKTDVKVTALSDVGRFTRAGELNGHVANDFSGAAKTQRAGRLLAQLAVTVVAVEPNGDLRVSGEQLLEVNDEQQRIRLEGRVRSQDIGENNSVLSNRIAEARIQYVGDGPLAAGQKVGLITRILTWLGL